MAELMGIFEGHVPEIMVPENISIGSTVLRDIRAHLNLPPKSLVKLGPGSLTHFFRLDAESGQLISVRSVDLESPEMCETEKSCCRVEVNGLSTSTIVEPQLAPRGSLTSGILNDHSSLQNERRTPDENKACRLMAFVLASATVESQLAPISKLYITITDLNDNPPVFKVENTNLKYELTETTSSPPRIHVAFLEGRIVEITITDVNDNAPVIRFEKDNKIGTDVEPGTIHTRTSAHYEVWIKEDIVKGSPVTYFSTLDPDSAENGRVSCNLLNWTDRFRLREFAGLYGIETLTEFDRETTDVYYLTIKCQDQGVPPLQNSQILIIHVEDVNDLPPSFPLPIYQFHVLEDSVSGTPLLPVNANYPVAVTATDPDLNSTIVYRLEPLEPNRAINTEARLGSVGSSSAMDHLLFRIDPRLATLTAQGELDRETRALLAFHVCADDGKHSTCTDVTVILDDVNDNRPIFDRDTYVLRVEENQLSNKPLVIFRVTDADSNNQGFTFEFVNDGKPLSKITSSAMQKTNNSEIQQYKTQFEPGSVRYHFALRENTLYLRRPLDRELRSSYHFFIRAVDVHDFSPIREFVKAGWTVNHPQNLTSQAEIFVDVGDVNDNAPILIFPNSTGPLGNRLTVSCHETMGSSVGRLQATDTDLGQNASVLFTLIHTPEVDQLFYLDTNSGELFVNTGQLEEKCGQSAIMVVSADDQGSIESKKSRAAPVERLLIKLEDKPTLAEIIAAEARHKLRHLGEGAVGSAVQNRDASTIYSSLSARAILSVVLGGSTVFLIGLLIVWMILLVYNRSKRQKRLNQLQLVQTKRQSHNTAVNPQLQAAVNSPERMLYGTISSEERCASLPSQTDRTWSVRNSEKPCGSTAFPIGVDLQYGFVVKEDMDYPQTKEGNYGQYSVRLANSPTLTSSVSPTASIPFESQRADRPPRIWHCDTQACHNLHLDTCSVDDLARTRSKTWTRTDMPKKSLQTFTLGRLLPKWFTNNLPPRPKTGRNTPLWSTPEPIGGQLLEANQLFYSKKHSAKNDDHSPKHYLLLPTTLRGLDRPSSGNSIHPSSNQVIYATCRRENLKPVTFAPATMNNQNDSNICQFTPPSYLTPPTTRHLKQEQKVNTIDTQVSPINKHNDYTTLIKDSYRPDTNDFKSASATPYLTQQSGPTPIHQTRSNAPSTEQYSRTAQESVLPQICPGELVYPCCCASCEPSCDSTWMVYDGVSAGQSGSDSTRTCPQCHSLETQRSSRTYHASDCPKSVQTNADIEEPMPGTSNPRARTPQTQGSTNYLSVQELFNSCV
ncbi:hypothetical protein EG68_01209 [Paragonimus skrjabini miyazakii]|uniref:Cadherin domain-containing protein n=1 Tax=Paragonimus skrjabini miyazakii TaxID=59628 RepID=A0A8S9Z1W6_9TREM|nr:hypothetical protein EG68_01209 [Paragonimus skrjabini miyazakii]